MSEHWYDSACYWYEKARYEQYMSQLHNNQATKYYNDLQLVRANVERNKKLQDNRQVSQHLKRKRSKQLRKLEEGVKKKKIEDAAVIVNKIHNFADIAGLSEIDLDIAVPHLKQLKSLIEPAKQLEALVGLKETKQELYKIIMNQLHLNLQKQQNVKVSQGMMNICISGPPGTGKTTLCSIIGKMFASTGTLTKGHLVVAKRGDFIGQYLGQTTPRTMKVLESALGGVLLIDEVYGLGGSGNRDSFAEECVNAINEYMSLHPENLLVIIAGYKEDIESNFFAQNKGLKRRFPVLMELNGYSGSEMYKIFCEMTTKAGWSIETKDETLMGTYIQQREKDFPYFAGDMESLLLHTKFAAAERIWKSLGTKPSKLTLEDLKMGHKKLLPRTKENARNQFISSMYT